MKPPPTLGREVTPDATALLRAYFAIGNAYKPEKLAVPEPRQTYSLLTPLLFESTSTTGYEARRSTSTTYDVGRLTDTIYRTTSGTASRGYGVGVTRDDVVYAAVMGGSPDSYGR